MVNDGGGSETEQKPSILKELFKQPRPVAIPQGVENRLQQVGSETFGYTPDQLRLASENNYDLSTVKGKAGFASFLGNYYKPKEVPEGQQSDKDVHRVALHNGRLEFPTVDNTGPTDSGH